MAQASVVSTPTVRNGTSTANIWTGCNPAGRNASLFLPSAASAWANPVWAGSEGLGPAGSGLEKAWQPKWTSSVQWIRSENTCMPVQATILQAAALVEQLLLGVFVSYTNDPGYVMVNPGLIGEAQFQRILTQVDCNCLIDTLRYNNSRGKTAVSRKRITLTYMKSDSLVCASRLS